MYTMATSFQARTNIRQIDSEMPLLPHSVLNILSTKNWSANGEGRQTNCFMCEWIKSHLFAHQALCKLLPDVLLQRGDFIPAGLPQIHFNLHHNFLKAFDDSFKTGRKRCTRWGKQKEMYRAVCFKYVEGQKLGSVQYLWDCLFSGALQSGVLAYKDIHALAMTGNPKDTWYYLLRRSRCRSTLLFRIHKATHALKLELLTEVDKLSMTLIRLPCKR